MTLHVETTGDGPDLVLLHGWGLHGGVFEPLVARLSARFRTHVVDLPGHGRSPWPGARSPACRDPAHDTLTVWAAAVAETVPSPAAWIGWSLGGMVAIVHARSHPGSVTALVTVATTPRFTTAHDWPHATAPGDLARFSAGFDDDYRRAVTDFLTLQVRGDGKARALLRTLRPRLFAHGVPDAAGLAAGLDILHHADLRDGLGEVRPPLLAMGGARDRLVPPQAVEALGERAANGRSVILERAAHVPFLSEPERFAGVVGDFLDEESRRKGVAPTGHD